MTTKGAHAVVGAARTLWVAIFLCLICGGIGALVIPVFAMRLIQWNRLAKECPV